jgi:3-oxoacyl-[acyl-carrier protein] reductase
MTRPGPLVGLVTGASRGIGRATAEQLAEAGVDLVLTSTKRGGVAAVARECRARGREVLEAVYLAGSRRSADALAQRALRRFGRVDLLVNNAGTVLRRPLASMRDGDFEAVLAVNLFGPFHLCRRLVPGMVTRGFGRIVNLSSISATLGTAGATAYNASKWALDGLTKSLGEELRGTGVVVSSVLPGSVDTEMLKGSGYAAAMSPQDVAGVIRYLALDAPEAVQGGRMELFG